MLKMTSSNFSATSLINETNVVFYNATIQEAGSTTISKTIADKELYLQHKEECDSDYEEFEAQISSYITEE